MEHDAYRLADRDGGRVDLVDLTLGVHHEVADEPDRRWLRSYLSRSAAARRPQETARVLELMVHYGSIAFASEFAAGVARRAEVAMDYAFAGLPDTPAKRFVRDLVPFMVERTV